MKLSRSLSFLLVPLLLLAPDLSFAQSKSNDKDAEVEEALRKETSRVQSLFVRDLARASAWAAKNGLASEARKDVLEHVRELDPTYKSLAKLEKIVEVGGKAPAGADAEKLQKSFAKRMKTAEGKHADRLFSFASRCMQFGLFTRAWDLVNGVLKLDPDHKKARKILGWAYDRKDKKWISSWEAKHRKTHYFTEDGWIQKKWKSKWNKGLRNYKGQWVSVAEEKRIRNRNEYNPFTIETEHFQVLTNLGRKEGLKYALILEGIYSQFFRVFIGYFDQKRAPKLLFNRPDTKKKHKVYIFPSREAYLLHVKSEKGNEKVLRESAGFYASGDGLSRFYWSPNVASTLNTMYHEITHQLLRETKKGASPGGSVGNNWVVEGIAVYSETWQQVDGKWKAGVKTDISELVMAKSHVASNSSFDLRAFAHVDNQEFHKTGRGLNYALSGALAHFFMHYNDEVYREGFVSFLSAYYMGKVRKDSLVKYLDVEGAGTAGKFATLQKQFLSYMATLGESPAAAPTEDSDAATGG